MINRLISASLMLLLTGCASINSDNYKEMQPPFNLEGFFTGNVKGWGIVQNRSGELVQRFEVDIAGQFIDNVLTLDETFEYGVGDGPRKRVWSITKQENGRYTGQADDVLNEANGQIFGNALNWRYQMDLPVGGRSYRVKFDDWMWSFDENTVINRAYIRKFGITFAEVTLFMQKRD